MRSTLSVGYQHVRGLHLIISVNQNVPTCVAAGTNNGAVRIRLSATTASIPRWPTRTTTACTSRSCSGRCSGAITAISYTYSKALDNVGEFFFSAPINNFNIWQDYGRSDDDQRNRLVFDGTIHSSMAKASYGLGAFQPRLSADHHAAVLFAATIQHHHRRQHHPGHRRAAHHQWSFHQPQCGLRLRLFQS